MKHLKIFEEFENGVLDEYRLYLYNKLKYKVIDFILDLDSTYHEESSKYISYIKNDEGGIEFRIYFDNYFNFNIENDNKYYGISKYIFQEINKYNKLHSDQLYYKYIYYRIDGHNGDILEEDINKIELSKDGYELWLSINKFGL